MPRIPLQDELSDSVNALLTQYPTRRGSVYLWTTGLTVATMCIAAGAPIEIAVRAPAMLRPVMERQTLRALVDGTVERTRLLRGVRVQLGDTLLRLVASATEKSRVEAAEEMRERESLARELSRLTRAGDESMAEVLGTPKDAESGSRQMTVRNPAVRAAIAALRQEWRTATPRVTQDSLTTERIRALAVRGYAAPSELENALSLLETAREERLAIVARQRAQWAQQLVETTQHIGELSRELARLAMERGTYVLIAPVTGTLEELAPLTPGSVVRSGDVLATISPATTLEAEAFVTPGEVPRLHAGMAAKLLVDGYDVQEWGAVDAVVTSVGQDYMLMDGHPVFRVALRPLASSVTRRDGRTMPLLKGLRCQVRILITHRRLAVLLRHRAREWVDPTAPLPR